MLSSRQAFGQWLAIPERFPSRQIHIDDRVSLGAEATRSIHIHMGQKSRAKTQVGDMEPQGEFKMFFEYARTRGMKMFLLHSLHDNNDTVNGRRVGHGAKTP